MSTPTPHNAQPPQWRNITKEDPPQFPCWFWQHGKAIYLRDWCLDKKPSFYHVTHWHPDQPTAPEGRPEETSDNVAKQMEALKLPRIYATQKDYMDMECPASALAPVETATPTPEQLADAAVPQLELYPDSNAASVNNRVILGAIYGAVNPLRAQLKSMTDQFLAVSGQLGEARKLLAVAKCPNCDGCGWFEDVQPNPHTGEAEQVQRQCQWCDERAAHLAQSDSPGAGVKGEGL